MDQEGETSEINGAVSVPLSVEKYPEVRRAAISPLTLKLEHKPQSTDIVSKSSDVDSSIPSVICDTLSNHESSPKSLVMGRSKTANRAAASLIKATLEGGTEPEMEEDQRHIGLGNEDMYKLLDDFQDSYLLAQAYRRAYFRSSRPPPASQGRSQASAPRKNTRGHGEPVERLRLPGLGSGRQRNVFGKTIGGGQEVGKGVIGASQVGLSTFGSGVHMTKSEAGCDLPMVKYESVRLDHQSYSPPPQARNNPFEYQVPSAQSFPAQGSDWSPLAVEHPSRKWNNLIHSLTPDLQPVIKWDYEKTNDGLTTAQMSLGLPPTHPAISKHPLARTLPRDKHTLEYLKALEVLGGVKKWIGEPHQIKTDAHNSALAKAISEGALDWIHGPTLESVHEDEEEDESVATKPALIGLNDTKNVQISPDLRGKGACHNTDEIEMHDGEGNDNPDGLKTAVLSNQTNLKDAASSTDVFKLVKELSETFLEDHPGDQRDFFQFATIFYPLVPERTYTLTIGHPQARMRYTETSTDMQPEQAMIALCQRALDDGFELEAEIAAIFPQSVHSGAPRTSQNPGALSVPYREATRSRQSDDGMTTLTNRGRETGDLNYFDDFHRFNASWEAAGGRSVTANIDSALKSKSFAYPSAVSRSTSPTYTPSSLRFNPVSQKYNAISPTYKPVSPMYNPVSPTCIPVSPTVIPSQPPICVQASNASVPLNSIPDVKWIEQLSHFCRVSGLPQPKYSQEIEPRSEGTVFLASVQIEDDTFKDDKSFQTISAARESIARMVYSVHFGQKAVVNVPARRSPHVSSWRQGSRGNRVWKR